MNLKAKTGLLARTMCPHCWKTFEPHEVLWIAAHPELRGDQRLGPDQPMRFLPSRFTPRGTALDPRGEECRDLACPGCHLTFPRALLELHPWFVSILGTPACGKSFFLTSMLAELRRNMVPHFGLTFTDTDASFNASVIDYEQQLFYSATPDDYVGVGALIRKTEEQGELYNSVLQGERAVSYPRPFLFTLRPQEGHWNPEAVRSKARVVCLYDNAGESFLAGKDSVANPVTRHLANSSVLMYLFDPTQNPKFSEAIAQLDSDGQRQPAKFNRQEMVLVEAATRVRRFANLSESQKHDKPLLVVVTKRDLWGKMLTGGDVGRALVPTRAGPMALNPEAVEAESRAIQALLEKYSPAVVQSAEQFADKVYYFGVSALGTSPIKNADESYWSVRPRDIVPQYVGLPFLFGLYLQLPGMIPTAKRASGSALGAKS